MLARINTNWLKKSKAEMDTIAPCVDCGGPWTDEIERHQKAILRGASPAVLVCDTCFKAMSDTRRCLALGITPA